MKKKKARMKYLLMQADASEWHTSQNEANLLYGMRQHLKRKQVFFDHPTSTCSYTIPSHMSTLDCERPVSSTACGGNHDQYGPEFMFGHIFPKLPSPLQGKAIGITKVAVGGTTIHANWMEDNKNSVEGINYWFSLVDAIKGAKGSLEAFVWFQGESDMFKGDENKANYFNYLNKFVADVRQEIYNVAPNNKFASPNDIPVIIVELGRWIWTIGPEVINAQRQFVQKDPNAAIVRTGAGDNKKTQLTQFHHYDSASQLIIGKRIATAMAKLLRENDT